jgi:hypothetical protein
MEFESFNEALLYIGIEEGGSAPVDSLLAIIDLKELTLVELQKLLKLKVLKKEEVRLLQLKSLNQHQLKNRNHCTRDIN